MKIGTWELSFLERIEIFPREALTSAQKLIQKWVGVFPKEETWVMESYGVPSLIIRLDCFLGSKGELKIVEVEERPAGIGVAKTLNKQFAEKLEDFLKLWPRIAWVSSDSRGETGDDYLWASPPQNDSDLLMVRCRPDERDFLRFRKRSISTISTKGNKSYGLPMGLWRKISWGEDIPWEKPFVLKPAQGSKCEGITIWIPKDILIHGLSVKGGKLNGSSTRTRVERTLSSHGTMFLQHFTSPMICPHLQSSEAGPYFMLYRIFFYFDPVRQEYAPMGGVWTARPRQLLLHGASDAFFGPLAIED